MIAKPPTTSFDSVKGPSVVVTSEPDFRTRAPSALGRHPSVAISQPAVMPISISFPIFSISSGVGGVLVSACL
jgi:hypothetical protein